MIGPKTPRTATATSVNTAGIIGITCVTPQRDAFAIKRVPAGEAAQSA
jgi:hypothetical protein